MKNRVTRTVWRALAVVLFIAIGGAAGTALYVASALQPTEAREQEVRIAIPAGYGSGQIADLLEQNGLIRDAFAFKLYLKYKKQGARFQAGEYAMKPGMPLDDIIAKLNEGDTVKEDVLRFTIPEGFTVPQIADRLSGLPGFDRQAFLELAGNKAEFASGWAAQIPDDPRIRHRLEGYLFPETYEMKKDSPVQAIVERMLQELDRKLNALPPDWPEKLRQSGLTFHQMMTVASLVEREVVVDEERPIVASVIYNRLKKNMKLQIDATVQYVLDKPKERLFEKDLQIESPYNTYLHPGLPPGPIASPSLKSIRAALYPAETNYYYYVTKKDGSQGHYFAETHEQHLRNIEESKKR